MKRQKTAPPAGKGRRDGGTPKGPSHPSDTSFDLMIGIDPEIVGIEPRGGGNFGFRLFSLAKTKERITAQDMAIDKILLFNIVLKRHGAG